MIFFIKITHNKSMKKVINNKLFLFIPIIIIMIISFLNMYNAKLLSSLYISNLTKQIIWYLISFSILIIIRSLNIKFIYKYSFLFYLLTTFLLLYVLIFGKVTNGAKAWINFGFFSFQPSEIAKLSLTISLSKLASNYQKSSIKKELVYILKILILTLIPSILVFLEPDTGAIIFFILIAFTVLVLSPIHKFWYLCLLGLGISGIALFIILYIFNQDLLINLIGTSFFYRVERIITFKTMSSYQLENALIAMGSSSLFGSGLGKVSLYIPEAPTDFIFAFTISNFGLLTGFLVLICYFFIDLYLINKFLNTPKSITYYILACFIIISLFSQLINISMNLGLLPIIGIPLPLLSYGGSSLIIYFMFLGLTQKKPYNNMV